MSDGDEHSQQKAGGIRAHTDCACGSVCGTEQGKDNASEDRDMMVPEQALWTGDRLR